MIVIVDHRDSFTFNIAHLVRQLGRHVVVVDCGQVDLQTCLTAEAVILGPGPHGPTDVPQSMALLKHLAGRVPILGVCLGHQIIGMAYGGRMRRASRVVHGTCSEIRHHNSGLFEGLDNPVSFVRYHSRVIDDLVPEPLRLDAVDEDGDVAAVAHRDWPIWGVQFHPESLLSHAGTTLVQNFITRVDAAGLDRRPPFIPACPNA